jgi:hypothetical protein
MSKIITTTSLTAYMGATLNPQQASTVVNGMNRYVENRTSRCWGELNSVEERYDWNPLIWLRHQDVQSIESIVLGYPGLETSTLDATSYFFNSYGRVTMYLQQPTQFNPSAVNNDLVLISYVYGYTGLGFSDEDDTVPEVPEDLLMATLGIAAHYYDWLTNGQKDVVSAGVGTFKLTFSGSVRGVGGGPDGNSPASSLSTDQQNWDVIDSYKMRRL